MLQPPVKGDERYPSVVSIPIQVTISPVGSDLQDAADVTITVLGGTATGMHGCIQKAINLHKQLHCFSYCSVGPCINVRSRSSKYEGRVLH